MLDDRKLSLTGKVRRLGQRLKDPQWRKFGRTVFMGKMLGLALVFVVMMGIPAAVTFVPKLFQSHTAYAADTMPAMPGMAAPAAATVAAVDPATTQPAMKSDVNAATQAATQAAAAAGADPTLNQAINPLNTVWTLVAAFLVFGMQVGFTMLEAGFCRSRETVNVLVECVFDTCLCGVLYYAFGYAFMFGAGNGFIGWHDPLDATKSWFFLQHGATTGLYNTTTNGVPILAHWIFQFAFADCASTICSGTMIGRTGFIGDILYSVCVSGFIYPIIGHWAWGPDGFLATMGTPNPTDGSYSHLWPTFGMNFHDFAGSTVVHSIGGWIALAGGIVLGPRLGRRFKRDGGQPMMPHDLTIAICGGLLLWFGWYGFNPGSTLSAMDFQGISRVAANTTLAACAAGLSAVFMVYFRTKKWDPGAITNGFLAGLVAITCPCYWVSPLGACFLGGIAGIIVILGTDLLEYLRIDDPIGAWPVHGLCGVWGTLSLGFFASGEYSAAGSSASGVPVIDNMQYLADGKTVNPAFTPSLTGLFYGNHDWHCLAAQCIGSATICISTFVIAFIVFKALDIAGILRISKEGEIEGMDLHEHGINAYPDYVIQSHAMPGSSAAEMEDARKK